MLRLQTPMVLGSKTYTVLLPGRGEWDLRARRINFQLVPASEEADHLRLGKEEDRGNGREVFSPPVVLTLDVQDNEDPVVNAVLQKFTVALEALEQFIEVSLADQGYQFGEDTFALAATFEPSSKEYQNERPVKVESVE